MTRPQTEAAIKRRQERPLQDARDSANAWHALITESVEKDIADAVKRGIIRPDEASARTIDLHIARIDRLMAAIERAQSEADAR